MHELMHETPSKSCILAQILESRNAEIPRENGLSHNFGSNGMEAALLQHKRRKSAEQGEAA